MALQVWLPLTQDFRNQGLANISYTGTPVYKNSGKLSNKSLNLNTRITCTCPTLENKTIFSITFWAKVNTDSSLSTDWVDVINFTDKSTNNTTGYLRWETCYSSTYSSRGISMHDNGTYAISSINGGSLTTKDKWFHFAFTVGTDCRQYVNGILVATTVANGGSLTSNFWIGETNGINGEIQDVRIYDHCLTPEEVKKIAQGLVLHYPLNHEGLGNTNLITNSKLDESWTYPSSSYSDKYSPITTIIPSASQYTLSFDAKSTVNGDKIRTHYYSPNTTTTCVSNQGTTKTAADGNMDFTLTTQWQRYWVTYTQTETTAVKHLICPRLVSGQGTGTISVRNVKFEEGAIATPWCPNSSDIGSNATVEYDCSGFCNNGTRIGNITWSTDTPKYQVSTEFNDNTYIKYKGPENMTYATYSLWVKQSSFTQYGMIHGQLGSPEVGNSPWFAMNTEGSGLWAYIGSNTPQYTKAGTDNLAANTWYHLAYVWNNGVAKWYLNGEPYGNEVTYTTRNTITNSAESTIGDSYTGTSWAGTSFKGKISDFRLYATALSAEEILDIYNNTAPVHTSLPTSPNLWAAANQGIINKTFTGGLSSYTQSNCQVTLTDDGYRIYRPPNLNTTDNGNTMWGGFVFRQYTPLLLKGHTYMIKMDIKGQTSNSSESNWSNQTGWSGGAYGLSTEYTWIEDGNLPTGWTSSDYVTRTWRFVVTGNTYKECTTSYSSFYAGIVYPVFRDFKFGFTYANTGTLGTDLYIKNIRLYDITYETDLSKFA